MKNKQIIAIFIISLAIILSGCAKQEEQVVEKVLEETQLAEDIKEEVIETTKPVIEKKEELKIFNPDLTYPGAYNGPLYATS